MMKMIDADALIENIQQIWDLEITTIKAIRQVATEIGNAPTVEPERKKGHWIDDNCSECGQYVYHGDSRNFCPNCGADMRGEQDAAD